MNLKNDLRNHSYGFRTVVSYSRCEAYFIIFEFNSVAFNVNGRMRSRFG